MEVQNKEGIGFKFEREGRVGGVGCDEGSCADGDSPKGLSLNPRFSDLEA
jgi:hypothetical protein